MAVALDAQVWLFAPAMLVQTDFTEELLSLIVLLNEFSAAQLRLHIQNSVHQYLVSVTNHLSRIIPVLLV